MAEQLDERDGKMDIAIIGLSLSSSWGNGHATTWRSLMKGLRQRGHNVSFFERSEPWYEANRDLQDYPSLHFYASAKDLLDEWRDEFRKADAIIIGSYVRETARLVHEFRRGYPAVLAFYDIDTPVTIAQLQRGQCGYLERELLPEFDLYLSFAGGAVLDELRLLGVRRPEPLYCSVDPDVHSPVEVANEVDLGYLGTWSEDRQPGLEELLFRPATDWRDGRFTVAGAQYPDANRWPQNVHHVAHLPPQEHAGFYCGQRFTLNLTRADMRRMGYSPSVRLFEAACCGTPVISDTWTGLNSFFRIGEEILVASSRDDVLAYIREMTDGDRATLSEAARARVLESHTGLQRAVELESQLQLPA
ncbi:MAG: glycosyltransferase [Woeseia sp.]